MDQSKRVFMQLYDWECTENSGRVLMEDGGLLLKEQRRRDRSLPCDKKTEKRERNESGGRLGGSLLSWKLTFFA